MTEVLPDSWEEVALKSVVSKLVDGSHNPPKKQDSGKPMLSARNIDNNEIVFDKFRYIHPDDFDTEQKRTRIQPGDVLLTIVGTIGRAAVVPTGQQNFTLQRSVAVMTPEGVLPKFLMYQLQAPHVQRYFEENARGTAQKGVYLKTLGQTPVRIAPLSDQKRIVAEIEKQFSRLDEAVANLKRVKANLKRYKAAVLKAAVEGKLTEEWRAAQGRANVAGGQEPGATKAHPDVEPASRLLDRILAERRAKWEEAELAKMEAKGKAPKNDKWKAKYKEPVAPDTSKWPELPEGWVWASITQIADVASGNTPAGILGVVDQTGDVPWFKVGDMNHEENQRVMRHSDAWLSHAQVTKLGLRVFPPNTVLFPKRGGAIATNKKRLLDSPGCADLNVMGITPAEELASYFFSWFDAVDLAGLSDGSNVPQINHKDIDPLSVPIPPFTEQHQITTEVDRHLSLIRETETQVDINLKRAERLRQSILTAAFAGRLRGLDADGGPEPGDCLHVVAEPAVGYEDAT